MTANPTWCNYIDLLRTYPLLITPPFSYGAHQCGRVFKVNGQEMELVTSRVVDFVGGLKEELLPIEVLHECDRAFVNAVGCIVGGARHALVETAYDALVGFFGPPSASLLGRGSKADPLNAALINGLAGAAYSFDDTYSEALLHPSVPLAAALLALAERTRICGREFRTAFAAGMEVACRLTKAIATPPAEAEMAWSQTGIVSGISIALAAGKLLRLTNQQLEWAVGIAASESAGTRSTHGSMAASLIFGHSANIGLRAAFLAEGNFTSAAKPLEHRYGFANVFTRSANLAALVDELGQRFELKNNTYKPYPCGLVIHPAVDGVLQIKAGRDIQVGSIERIGLVVSPAALKFGFRPEPKDDLEAKVSLHHWVAAALSKGKAGLVEGTIDVVHDPEIRRLRALIEVSEGNTISSDAAEVEIVLRTGERLVKTVSHCVGSLERPMTDDELQKKFLDQVTPVIGLERATALSTACWNMASLDDTAAVAALAI